MKNKNEEANPNTIFPIMDMDQLIYVKPTITKKNIIVGDFTYFGGSDFEKSITHHYEFIGDKLIVGKFCQIANNVEFIMNGANHQMNAVSTFPFYIFPGWQQNVPNSKEMPFKGDTIIGNDVWIGQNTTILPGIQIGDGAIIGANSVVSKNVEPYTIVAGNPAQIVRKRFDSEMIDLLLKLKWWDMPIVEINKMIPILTNSNLTWVKKKLKGKL